VPQQLTDLLFAGSAVALIAFSLAVVLARNPVRAVLLLILSFLPTALIYVMLQAPFVGILQILVYAGAIMMLFTFVVMMINPDPGAGETPNAPKGKIWNIIWAISLMVVGLILIPPVYHAAESVQPVLVSKPGFGTLASLAELIFRNPGKNPFTVSFELISALILVGIIAAVNFSRRHRGGGAS